jgi:hypothetical protein
VPGGYTGESRSKALAQANRQYGLARVWLPGDERPAGDRQMTARAREPGDLPVTPRSSPGRKAVDQALVHALESHIKTLQGDKDALLQQLAGAEARIAEQAASLAAEKAMTEKAIAAFASLAERLDALAAERARPWWRRLSG